MPYLSYPLVIVTWNDHSGDAGWIEKPPLDDDIVECKTIGYLYSESDKAYHVVNSKTKDKEVGGLSTILKSCVVSLKILRKSM